MSDKGESDTIRNTIIGTVVGGVILAMVMWFVEPAHDLIVNAIKRAAAWCVNLAAIVWGPFGSVHTFHGWILALISIVVAAAFLNLGYKMSFDDYEYAHQRYIKDVINGVLWCWRHTGLHRILDLKCYCFACKLELVITEDQSSGNAAFHCDNCDTTTPAKPAGNAEYLKGYVKREINRRASIGVANQGALTDIPVGASIVGQPSAKAAPKTQLVTELFRPFVVKDSKIEIEWRILKDPDEWIHDVKLAEHSPDIWKRTVGGPYHADSQCMALLEVYDYGDTIGHIYGDACPQCHKKLFRTGMDKLPGSDNLIMRKGGEPEAKLSVLLELQRLARKQTYIGKGTKLEGPSYWQWLEPLN